MSLGVQQPLHVAQENFQSIGVTFGPNFCQNQGLCEICKKEFPINTHTPSPGSDRVVGAPSGVADSMCLSTVMGRR